MLKLIYIIMYTVIKYIYLIICIALIEYRKNENDNLSWS